MAKATEEMVMRSEFGTNERRQPRLPAWKRLLRHLAAPGVYRPERHYMRGPGPKWRERHGESLWAHDPSNSA